ncbi:MAG TPA: chromate resistance protein ChrB domain-containing protein [Gemmatimonadales bacterium]
MHWITRERPKIDRVACPWLISRFIDPAAAFHFVQSDRVLEQARALGATPFDVEGVELSHSGPLCTFDALLAKYELKDPALLEIATIVRGADTARLDRAPQAAGLLALSLGLSHLFQDDHVQLAHGMVLYDALYAWARYARSETHSWNPQRGPLVTPVAGNG